jgi:hypothetical protein
VDRSSEAFEQSIARRRSAIDTRLVALKRRFIDSGSLFLGMGALAVAIAGFARTRTSAGGRRRVGRGPAKHQRSVA